MGCISSTDVKNPKKSKPNKDNNKHIQPALYKSKLDKSTVSKVLTPRGQQLPSVQKVDYPPIQKILKMSSIELLSQYEITQTLQHSTRLQGPKLLTNKIHGGVNVLRVYQCDRIDQQRLKKYYEILGFELYTDEEQNYLVIDQYCSGANISDLFSQQQQSNNYQQKQQLSTQQTTHKKQLIHDILIQVHAIITKFHTNKTYLGNLNIFSFQKLSNYQNQIRLVKYNVQNIEQNDRNYEMGHAHRNSYQADWQFFGYLVQFYYSEKSPIFISHKMQYVQTNQYGQEFKLISSLLKGRQVSKKQVQALSQEKIHIKNPNVLNGYRFCQDIIKLIKSRKRRMKHKATYYSKQIKQYYCQRNVKQSDFNNNQQQQQLWRVQNNYDNSLKQQALCEDNLHKLQMQRIFNSIKKYIQNVNCQCEEHLINYSAVGENFRKLKQVFIITDKRKKLQQLRQLISQIK